MPPVYNTIDTLKEAKRYFNFNSNKLDYIAKFLGVGKKMETGGLDLWKDIVFNKSPEAMAKMVAYCQMDVKVLESVFYKLNTYTQSKVNYAVLTGGDKFDCPQCGTSHVKYNKKVTTSAGTIHHWLVCNPCKKYFKVNNKTYQDWITYNIRKKNIS
jgi:DNA-directed RNA polymerase subunit M/transcription elongation factor TFIIS